MVICLPVGRQGLMVQLLTIEHPDSYRDNNQTIDNYAKKLF